MSTLTRHTSALLPLWALLACGAPQVTPADPGVAGPAQTSTRVAPPICERREHVSESFGERREDPYYWLRQRDDPAVIRYLEAENAFADRVSAPTDGLRKTLYQEMLTRTVEDDSSAPSPFGEYEYYRRTEAKKAYPIYCRKKKSGGPEQVLLDQNALAEGKSFLRIGDYVISPQQKLLAYTSDENGSERYSLRFEDLATGKLLADTIPDVYYSLAWTTDERAIYYVVVDAAQRPYRIMRHVLGTPASADQVVHSEPDEHYELTVRLTRSRAFVLIEQHSAITTEVLALDAAKIDAKPFVIEPRKQGVEYLIEHQGDRFFVLSNHKVPNFELYETPVKKPGRANWKTILPGNDKVTLSELDAFAHHLVVYERENGLQQIRVLELDKKKQQHRVSFEQPAYEIWPESNLEWQSNTLRFSFTSPITPETVFAYDLVTRQRVEKKVEPVRDYDASLYVSERIMAKAQDGVEVPISLVRRKETPLDGTAPLILNGYGAYGVPNDADFELETLPLLDRGVIVAIAHVRGGGEMGRRWKEDGMLAKKMNSFTDFIACAEHLIAAHYTSADRLAIRGRSAGGLLIGAVLNLRPDLFRAAVAGVPFVDVINTMSDASIPLTVIEWEEWGDPSRPEDYAWMRAYSPYDNVKAQPYPAIFVHAGLNDTRVCYWEPAKWVAKLRATKTDDRLLVLRTNMGAGHGGASSRYDKLEEAAFEGAFLLDQLGATGVINTHVSPVDTPRRADP